MTVAFAPNAFAPVAIATAPRKLAQSIYFPPRHRMPRLNAYRLFWSTLLHTVFSTLLDGVELTGGAIIAVAKAFQLTGVCVVVVAKLLAPSITTAYRITFASFATSTYVLDICVVERLPQSTDPNHSLFVTLIIILFDISCVFILMAVKADAFAQGL